jgi:HK97 family phage portal protein
VSPILAVVLDQAMASAALNQQIAFYLNGATASYTLETDQQLTADQTAELRRLWDDQTKGEKAGGTPILTWGLKAKPVGTAAKDSSLADMLKLTDQNIALAFRMPLQVLGIGGTPFASTEALMASWKSTGLGFALNHIEEAFGKLFRLDGFPNEYLEFDTDALLRSSFKEMMEALVSGTDKVLTKNEARARIGLGRKKGGDDLFMQMQDIAIGKPVEPKPAEPPPSPADATPPGDAADDVTPADGKMLGAMIYASFTPAAEHLRITQQ